MKHICICVLVSVFIFSCKKNEIMVSFSEARYTINITGKWSSPDFTVPPGAHFTTFIGMIHNKNAFLWKEGTKASQGIEVLAETGGGGPVLGEIDSMIAKKNALALVLFVAPSATGTNTVNFYSNSNYSCVSFASMLGPTPDWFIGIDLNNNNRWIADTTINLYAYDAGTEDGDMFGYNNPATIPQQDIHILSASQATVLANGNPVLVPIATAKFTRQ